MYDWKNHRKTNLKVHIILVAKYRRKIPRGRLDAVVKGLLARSCGTHGWFLMAMKTDMDHVHMLVQYPAMVSVASMLQILKQESTYGAWKTESWLLRRYYWKERTLWSDGYFASSIGDASTATIEEYIRNQG